MVIFGAGVLGGKLPARPRSHRQLQRPSTAPRLLAGALRIGSDFLAAHHPGPRVVYLPDPSWGIHPAIFAASGHTIKRYRYYCRATKGLDFQVCVVLGGGKGARLRAAWGAGAQLGCRHAGLAGCICRLRYQVL